jgi:uncharacterized cupin superfamily protein
MLGDATGLTRMGVNLRVVEPGLAGTNRHFHEVEEEWAYVLSGVGFVRIGRHRLAVRSGSFVGFPPGPRPHHFIAEGNEPLVLLEGGERRIAEDVGYYVDLGLKWKARKLEEATEPLPPEMGDPTQLVQIEDIKAKQFQHDVDPRARRLMRRVNRPVGLTRQAVCWSRVEAGNLSTAYHTHDRTDEWIFVLSGRATTRVGGQTFEVGPYDFVAHPASSDPHVMEPSEPLVYLMGGQIDGEDVVSYPEAGLRRVHGRLEPLSVP